jgi:hypothetical protein
MSEYKSWKNDKKLLLVFKKLIKNKKKHINNVAI